VHVANAAGHTMRLANAVDAIQDDEDSSVNDCSTRVEEITFHIYIALDRVQALM